jgi:predicted Fe-S protein YdhL (DUF1289 family)
MNCPHCGKAIEVQQTRAAAFRWASMTKAQRSAEMSRVRKLGVKRAKTKARGLRQNAGTQRPGSPDVSLATETRKPGSLK